jgi:hypothetical protein
MILKGQPHLKLNDGQLIVKIQGFIFVTTHEKVGSTKSYVTTYVASQGISKLNHN